MSSYLFTFEKEKLADTCHNLLEPPHDSNMMIGSGIEEFKELRKEGFEVKGD